MKKMFTVAVAATLMAFSPAAFGHGRGGSHPGAGFSHGFARSGFTGHGFYGGGHRYYGGGYRHYSRIYFGGGLYPYYYGYPWYPYFYGYPGYVSGRYFWPYYHGRRLYHRSSRSGLIY